MTRSDRSDRCRYIYIYIYKYTTGVNFPKKLQEGNERKNRTVKHGNSRTQKIILAVE